MTVNNKLLIKLLIIAIFINMTAIASATKITVCSSGCDYTSIQGAINSAITGDVIEVYSGNYHEHVNVNKKLTLKGIGLPIIDAGGSKDGITLSADGIILDGFSIKGSTGIKVKSNNNTITNNTLNNNKKNGIHLKDSNNNTITNNTLNNNKKNGILLKHSNNNTITNNTLNNNKKNGISLEYSDNNIIINNTVAHNKNHGISLDHSDNNLLYINNLLNNEQENAYDSDGNGNNWDNGVVGNHNSEFDDNHEKCYDKNGDHICDSSYPIPGGSSIDHYPLRSWITSIPTPTPTITPTPTSVPEFPTIALPIAVIFALVFTLRRKNN